MTIKLTNAVALFFILAGITTPLAYANSWPLFNPPDQTFLRGLNYLDTTSCPPGKARLVSNAVINIRDHLCQTFCPKTWNWITTADKSCHDLATEFEFQRYEINHYSENDNETLYSKITAFYGSKRAATSAFKIEMTTELDDHWYCIETGSDRHGIICANDT